MRRFRGGAVRGSLSAQQVTPAMIQRAKAMGATQEQIDAALAERNERSGRPSSTQAQGSEVVRSDPDRRRKIRDKAAILTAVPVFRSRGDTRCARTPIR